MKKYLIYSLIAGAALTTAASCDVNDWNDNLDGFEELTITDVQTISYTLTADDYANIAANDDNVDLAGDDLADALADVGTNCYFTDDIAAKDYIPNFLGTDDFEYFALDDGSAINLTYNVYDNHLPDEIAAFEAASEYTVTSADYIDAWGDEENYIEAFSPSTAATSHVPSILAQEYPDAESGDMVVVYYNYAATDPSFGDDDDDDDSSFELTSLLGSAALGDDLTIYGLVTGICTTGYILTDNTGSIFVYYGSSFDTSSYGIGTQIELTGTVAAYRTGLQFAGSSSTETIVGTQSYTYPTPTVYDGTAFDEAITRSTNELAIYFQFTGTVSVSGSYYNFTIDGAESAVGSTYYATDDQKALFTDGETYTVTGYFLNISSSKYVNFIVVDATAATSSAPRIKSVSVSTTATTAVYTYNGSKWAVESDIAVLQSDDYTTMGQTYKNLEDPDYYLPIYLKLTYPYAVAEDTQLVGYKYYNSGTSLACDQYVYDGSDWIKDEGYVEETAQFVKTSGEWMYDPNVTLTFEYSKGAEPATTYYQACVDWVYENIDKPLGSTSITSGKYYVTSYGNNEYYSGASAYYCNVDIRPSAAYTQYPDGYADMTDDEIQELMKERFCYEVMPGALATLHPDANTVDGLEVIYTINFVAYTGSGTEHVLRYEVTGPAEFTFLDCTWFDEDE